MRQKIVALYARTSTTDRQDPETQLNDLRVYAQARGFAVQREYVDRISGATTRRPALDELMADAKRRRFDAVLVWRFDRMGRSTKHLLQCLEDFRHLRIDFISFTESIDTGSAIGELVYSIFAAIAQFERSLIRERIHAGLRNARAKGKRLGRPRKASADVIRQQREKGLTVREIAKIVGVSHGTVINALVHPT